MRRSSRRASIGRLVRHARLFPAAVIILLGLACEDGTPTDGSVEPVAMQLSLLVAGTPINTLVVEVTGSDFATLVYNLTVENGVATGTIRIPPGSARTIHVSAFDAEGTVTHEGQTTIDVRPGMNPPVHIPLVPRSGQVPVTVTFGQYAVVVTPSEATIDAAVSTELQLEVTVSASGGGTLPNPAVSWATTNPALAAVSASGLVTGHLDGIVNIVALYEGVAGLSLIRTTGFGDMPACAWPWAPTNVDPCDPAIPAPGALSLANAGIYTYDTTTGVLATPGGGSLMPASAVIAQSGGPSVRVISATVFDVAAAATLRVTGSYPLVVLAASTATIAGTIDVSAAGYVPGPGGDETLFCSPAMDGENNASGSGGGGGGGYGTSGGSGGSSVDAGGSGGNPSGNNLIAPLRGGCSGGFGGGISFATVPGGGGGAIQVAARVSLTVSGSVRSAGGGGRGGSNINAGGGGGGAGGAILLESDAITIGSSASVCANGGSGGEGTDAAVTPTGEGQAGTCSDVPAATPNNVPIGGNGGAGGTRIVLPENGGGPPGTGIGGGGGGGGGSVGRVRIRGVTSRFIDTGATITPAPAP